MLDDGRTRLRFTQNYAVELSDDDLSLSLAEPGDLLANFGVEMRPADLAPRQGRTNRLIFSSILISASPLSMAQA